MIVGEVCGTEAKGEIQGKGKG